VVLRLGGRHTLGATFFVVGADYARRLAAVGGWLSSAVSNPVRIEQIARTGRVDVTGPVRVYEATDRRATLAAYHAAEAWLIRSDRGDR
jgi:SulP family sulfate permease